MISYNGHRMTIEVGVKTDTQPLGSQALTHCNFAQLLITNDWHRPRGVASIVLLLQEHGSNATDAGVSFNHEQLVERGVGQYRGCGELLLELSECVFTGLSPSEHCIIPGQHV